MPSQHNQSLICKLGVNTPVAEQLLEDVIDSRVTANGASQEVRDVHCGRKDNYTICSLEHKLTKFGKRWQLVQIILMIVCISNF